MFAKGREMACGSFETRLLRLVLECAVELLHGRTSLTGRDSCWNVITGRGGSEYDIDVPEAKAWGALYAPLPRQPI